MGRPPPERGPSGSVCGGGAGADLRPRAADVCGAVAAQPAPAGDGQEGVSGFVPAALGEPGDFGGGGGEVELGGPPQGFDLRHQGFLSLVFPFDTNNSTRVGAPCQALRVCSQSHFRVPYGTVGYLPVGSGGRPSAYVGVSYPVVTYDYVRAAYATVTYPGVTYTYEAVTYPAVTYSPVTFASVTYHGVTYTYVAVTYGYVGKSWH